MVITRRALPINTCHFGLMGKSALCELFCNYPNITSDGGERLLFRKSHLLWRLTYKYVGTSPNISVEYKSTPDMNGFPSTTTSSKPNYEGGRIPNDLQWVNGDVVQPAGTTNTASQPQGAAAAAHPPPLPGTIFSHAAPREQAGPPGVMPFVNHPVQGRKVAFRLGYYDSAHNPMVHVASANELCHQLLNEVREMSSQMRGILNRMYETERLMLTSLIQ